jgi:pimeloyl-ACP methyl ester carboxylesterase
LTALVLLGALFAAQSAVARQAVRLTTGAAADKLRMARSVPGCPNTGGLLDSISVPVNQSIAPAVQISGPLDHDVSFRLSAQNPAYVAAGDKVQGFLPIVTVPAGQVASNTFDLFGISVGATALNIVPLSSGFVTTSYPAGAWDVNKSGGSSKFVDANPPSATCRTAGSPSLSTGADVLTRCGTTVDGVAADGVTKLLMRTLAGLPGTACYELTSTSTLEQGTVETPLATTQAVGDLNYAFSLLRAPSAYGDDSGSRKVTVTFTFTPSIGNANTTTISADLTVLRPPRVLMHGLWSKPAAWDDSFVRNDATHTTVKGDYKATNASHFATNVPKVKQALDNARKQFRAGRNAATQVDVVGHSMGGILTRLYANSSDNLRPDNYNLGDIHRLITLDTPHWGSTLANLLVSLRQVAPIKVDTIGGIIGSVKQGAICDLTENSPALAGLGATAVPGSTISARGGSLPAYRSEIESLLTARACTSWSLGFPPTCNGYSYLFPQDRVDGFRFQQANDEIVGQTDQMGGLGGWAFADQVHTNVNTTPAVAAKAFALLDGPASGLTGTGFPAAQ